MAILYSCVAAGTVLLAEHLSASSSNASTVVKMILEKVEWADGLRKSYAMDNFVFHFVCGGAGLTVRVVLMVGACSGPLTLARSSCV